MAFGEAQFVISKDIGIKNSTIARLYGKFAGYTLLHGHFRWGAVKPFIDFQAKRTLDVGAGTGLMTFEVARRLKRGGTILASEFDGHRVTVAYEIAKKGNFKNVDFVRGDLRALGLQQKFDQVLAIDVLEHIEDDILALRQINGILKPDGVLVISVPTPLYPKYFGRMWAKRIGHVRDGYFIEELHGKLSNSGFKVLSYKYNTRFWASLFCFLSMYVLPRARIPYTRLNLRIDLILMPVLKYLALLLDMFSTDAHSCSLAVLAHKVRRSEESTS
jgi:2-polyprenyl-3-methyl-5-hydroxy-6-metoxy-1,4-benzoquinol methylase